MGTIDLWRVHPETVRHGRARQSSGIVEGPCGYRAREVSIGENSVYRETWGTKREGRNVAKCSSDPRVAYTGVKVQVRDLVRIGGIFDPFAPRGSLPGENSFHQAPGGKYAQETCAGCPQQRYVPGEPGKVRGRKRVGIVEGTRGTGPAGSVFGENSFFFFPENLGYKTRGAPCG